MKTRYRITGYWLLVIGVLASLIGGYTYFCRHQASSNPYSAFVGESWDIIKTNYWESISDTDLANLYQLALEKVTGTKSEPFSNKKQVIEIVSNSLNNKTKEESQQIVTNTVDVVLANLKPFGRSRLYTQKEEVSLSKTVNNVTDKDRYADLGITKDASSEQIAASIDKKAKQLTNAEKTATSAAEKQQIAEQKQDLQKSKVILSDDSSKKLYDASGVEPTLDYTLLSPRIFYLHLTKFSPTSLDEIQRVTQKYDKGDQLDTLILDLSDNIGGAIDGLPYFLGPFIGKDQYAYQFFRQGIKTDFKTQMGWLPSLIRYKRVVIIINENAQSTAEVMASVLKKYNVGLLVGKTTKGWGTVERVFPMLNQISQSQSYSIFLVHSLTLREDGEPIEGRGVEPVIDVGKEDWEQVFLRYYNDSELLKAVENIVE